MDMFAPISNKQTIAYLHNESKVAKTTRDRAIGYIENRFRKENPNLDVYIRIWTSDYYCWNVAVFPNKRGGVFAIASYWVEKFPNQFSDDIKTYHQEKTPDAVFVQFNELIKEQSNGSLSIARHRRKAKVGF